MIAQIIQDICGVPFDSTGSLLRLNAVAVACCLACHVVLTCNIPMVEADLLQPYTALLLRYYKLYKHTDVQ